MNQVIQGLLTDYVNVLAKDHPTAARIVQLYANQELVKGESSQPVPEPPDAPSQD